MQGWKNEQCTCGYVKNFGKHRKGKCMFRKAVNLLNNPEKLVGVGMLVLDRVSGDDEEDPLSSKDPDEINGHTFLKPDENGFEQITKNVSASDDASANDPTAGAQQEAGDSSPVTDKEFIGVARDGTGVPQSVFNVALLQPDENGFEQTITNVPATEKVLSDVQLVVTEEVYATTNEADVPLSVFEGVKGLRLESAESVDRAPISEGEASQELAVPVEA